MGRRVAELEEQVDDLNRVVEELIAGHNRAIGQFELSLRGRQAEAREMRKVVEMARKTVDYFNPEWSANSVGELKQAVAKFDEWKAGHAELYQLKAGD